MCVKCGILGLNHTIEIYPREALSLEYPSDNLPTVSAQTVINQILDAYLAGETTPYVGTISYGFFESVPVGYGSSEEMGPEFAPLSSNLRAIVADRLGAWADVANLSFQYQSGNSAQIMIGSNNLNQYGAGGWAYLPRYNGISLYGDVWLDRESIYQQDWNQSYISKLVLHELGHALGLSHAGDYNLSLGTREWANDSYATSVMSYYNPWGQRGYGWLLYDFPQTPMIYDIAAIQRLYGARMDVRAGNTIYGYNSNAGPLYDFGINQAPILTIWDGGGYDVIDLSPAIHDLLLSLVAGTSSSILTLDYNLGIAFGVTIESAIGGQGNDTIIGNSAANWLEGRQGNDSLKGDAGNDTLVAGAGSDTLTGGAGKDYFVMKNDGGSVTVTDFSLSNDVIGLSGVRIKSSVMSGRDAVITFNTGAKMTLIGMPDLDTLYSRIIEVGSTNPALETTATNTDTTGGGGPSIAVRVTGTAGADTLAGTNADELIYGLGLADVLNGGGGNDTLFGGSGNDTLSGGGGNDVFFFGAGAGQDRIVDLTAGQDRIVLASGISVTSVSTQSNATRLMLSDGGRIDVNALSIPQVMASLFDDQGNPQGLKIIGTTSADKLTGSNMDELIKGMAGNDSITAGGGNDTLEGGEGNDTLSGGAGNDHYVFRAGGGIDRIADLVAGDVIVLDGVFVSDVVTVARGLALMLSDGGQVQTSLTNVNTLLGQVSLVNVQTDPYRGTIMSDTLVGTDGQDDRLSALGGADRLTGMGGNDTLIGGAGNDTLTGGPGNDHFVFMTGDGADVITDFTAGDQIVLDGSLSVASVSFLGLSNATAVDPIATMRIGLSGGGTLSLNNVVASDVFAGMNGMTGMSRAGGTGTDTVFGTGGADTLSGGKGADVLNGFTGSDIINGGAGLDTLIGGAGGDSFVFAAGDSGTLANATDKIIDFNADEDKIDFNSGIGVYFYNKLSTSFSGSTLLATAQQAVSASFLFDANDVVLFKYAGRSYLMVNDGTKAFTPNQDLLVDVTGFTGSFSYENFI